MEAPGILAAAAVLGVTHGFEPDHAAGISALTTEADRWTHAAFVGGSFAAGHVIVVIAWVGVLTVAGNALASPGFIDAAGSTAIGVVLFGVALLLAATGTQRLRGQPVHAASGPASGPVSQTIRYAHRSLHHTHESRAAYLRTGVVGSLFALSPPVSMLALVSTVVPTSGGSAAAGAVAVYAVAITLTMALVGGGVGELFAVVGSRGERVHATFELVTSALVLVFALETLV